MSKYVGYVWPGKLRVPVKEVRKLFKKGAAVYRLYSDNTEEAVIDISEIKNDGEYGIECTEFSFEECLAANRNSIGAVGFSHGTNDVDDLLALMKDFFGMYQTVSA